ncbi:MAG TPA: SMP-30/gluconolactonase/LRE family protein [Caulobacteraceae bacterium]
MTPIACAVRRENLLGEGPVWDARRGRLWWVDIKGGRLEWLEPASGANGGCAVEGQVSAVAPRADGAGLVAARKDGIGILDPASGRFAWRFDPEPERPGNRANDGNVDLAGRFWFGTMDDGETKMTGAIYRLDADWSCTRILDGVGIANTLVCGPGGDRLYLADSRRKVIETLAIDPLSGAAGVRRSFADTRGQPFAPDGSAVDEQGFLWNAQWGGARIVRYTPDGSIDAIVPTPVDQPSSCAFGGADLASLYITTARWGLSAEALARQPLAGSLLAFTPGVRGLPLAPFAG